MVTKTAREGFAERFQQALNEAGFAGSTQRQLGKVFQVTPQAVRKWLAAEAMPTSERAPLVASILGVRKAWLIDNEAPMRSKAAVLGEVESAYELDSELLSISGEEFLLLSRFRTLSAPLRQSLLNLLEVLDEPVPGKSQA